MSVDESSGGIVTVARKGPVTAITWSRPAKKNAFNSGFAARLTDVISEEAGRSDCSVIELRAEGSVFCAGWDLDEISVARAAGRTESLALIQSGRRVYDAMDSADAVVVAVVTGPVFGFGVGVLCHADMVVAREGSTIGLPELKAGVVPASVLADLIGTVGHKLALKWCTDGRVGPTEAVASGLVTLYASDADVAATDIVGQLTAVDPFSLRATKRLAREMKSMDAHARREFGERSSVDHLVGDHD